MKTTLFTLTRYNCQHPQQHTHNDRIDRTQQQCSLIHIIAVCFWESMHESVIELYCCFRFCCKEQRMQWIFFCNICLVVFRCCCMLYWLVLFFLSIVKIIVVVLKSPCLLVFHYIERVREDKRTSLQCNFIINGVGIGKTNITNSYKWMSTRVERNVLNHRNN